MRSNRAIDARTTTDAQATVSVADKARFDAGVIVPDMTRREVESGRSEGNGEVVGPEVNKSCGPEPGWVHGFAKSSGAPASLHSTLPAVSHKSQLCLPVLWLGFRLSTPRSTWQGNQATAPQIIPVAFLPGGCCMSN